MVLVRRSFAIFRLKSETNPFEFSYFRHSKILPNNFVSTSEHRVTFHVEASVDHSRKSHRFRTELYIQRGGELIIKLERSFYEEPVKELLSDRREPIFLASTRT